MSSFMYFTKDDAQSFDNLGAITTPGFCVDVDSSGCVGKAYLRADKASSLWRSVSKSKGQDLSNLSKLFDRLAFSFESDYGPSRREKMEKALPGIRMLKAGYDQRANTDVVKIIEVVLKQGEALLVHLKKTRKQEGKNTSKWDLITCKRLDEESISGFIGRNDHEPGFKFYQTKLSAFASRHELSEKQQVLVENYQNALACGLGVYEDFLERYPSSLDDDQLKKLDLQTLSRGIKSSSHQGVVIPAGFRFFGEKQNERNTLGELRGHCVALGIRNTAKGYFLTIYNAGGGAKEPERLEHRLKDSLFHLLQGTPPIVAMGQTASTYGPLNIERTTDIVRATFFVAQRIFKNTEEAIESFRKPFASMEALPACAPSRRYQVLGNCVTANVREWLIDMFQQDDESELFNQFDQFGQVRGLTAPTREHVERGVGRPEKILDVVVKEDEGEGWTEIDFLSEEER